MSLSTPDSKCVTRKISHCLSRSRSRQSTIRPADSGRARRGTQSSPDFGGHSLRSDTKLPEGFEAETWLAIEFLNDAIDGEASHLRPGIRKAGKQERRSPSLSFPVFLLSLFTTEAVSALTVEHRTQVHNYLKATNQPQPNCPVLKFGESLWPRQSCRRLRALPGAEEKLAHICIVSRTRRDIELSI